MIEIHIGDITELQVDAVVNAANHSLLGGSGVDGAIHSAAGPELAEYNLTLGGCPTGDARISPGFNLLAKWVISTVGPVWRGGGGGEAEFLSACYRNSFEVALKNKVRSIAFPSVSTGMYRFPKQQAAQIALDVMRAEEGRFEKIIACCFSQQDADIYRALLEG